jgi:hypothetical protein
LIRQDGLSTCPLMGVAQVIEVLGNSPGGDPAG